MLSTWFVCIVAGATSASCAVNYAVPASLPGTHSPLLDPAPVGVSIEFFTFPDYMNVVGSTKQCLENLKELSGTWPPVRIGGTTQDRATYDASSPNAVTYTVSNPADAPASLTFGPSFMDLASTYLGRVTIGFNRRLNNLANTLSAATYAHGKMKNMYAIELGNEPNFYSNSDPIAGGSWSAAADRTSQVSWQASLGANLSANNIVQAGVYFGTGQFSIASLAAQEGSSLPDVKSFCSHNYPQSSGSYNLSALMSHSAISKQIAQYAPEFAAAKSKNKEYIMGETNSATQGGGGISPTFGAGLWIMDYVLQSVNMGIKYLNFHQGTIGNCQYCWWGRYSMGAPYYGAYFAAMALANAEYIVPLDSMTTQYAGYAIYKGGRAIRVLLYNSDYYESGTRSKQTFTLSGLASNSVTAKRLTAASAISRQDQGSKPTFGGQTFQDGTCRIQGTAATETATVGGGKASFTIAASEALLIYL